MKNPVFGSTLLLIPIVIASWGCGSGGLDSNEPDSGVTNSGGNTGTTVASRKVGAPCDLMADAGPTQAVYNAQALECPSRICMKPIAQVGGVDTGAFCSAPCQTDDDCNGILGGLPTPTDRCATGFTCAVVFVVGPLCCKPMCVCKDFMGPKATAIPPICQSGSKDPCNPE